MIEDKKLINRIRLVLFKFIMEKMSWKKAIEKVLREVGRPMNSADIAKQIIERGYYKSTKSDPDGQVINVNTNLYSNPGWFRKVDEDLWELVDKSVTTSHTPTAGLTSGRTVPVVVRPSTAYAPGDSNYKEASDFITSKVPFDDEKELLELIVNFRLPLVNRVVCFADIVDNLEVQILDEEGKRPQSKDIDKTHLQKKLDKLRKQIEKIENKAQSNPNIREEPLFNRMRSAAKEAEQLLQKASGKKVKFEYPILGEFIPGRNPKVVIYLKSIDESIKKRKEKYPWRSSESRWQVMAAVFVHEMFHAWNYFVAGQNSRSVLAIDEPMVEFETLYFLKELETFTKSLSHPLHENVSSVRVNRESRVQDKQQSIGDLAAYGFGYYLFEKLGKSDVESIEWIETYSKKSASIKNSNKEVKKEVKKVEYALIPVYPFMSEADVMKWFKEIIFAQQATSKIVGKYTTATKVGLPVSLRDLVHACIKTIGRKYFEAKELYAFAPIFKLCAAVSGNLEDTLKQQLDELVKDGVLEVLSDGCYSRKLAGVDDKPNSKVKTPAKSKGGYTRGSSIPFAVKFPDGVIFDDNKAVKTFIKSLQKIGLSNVQHVGIMIQGYNLVSDVERPSDGKNKWQDYVDDKYIYTKLANSLKIKYLNQIAKKLGISIEIYDI